MLTPSTAESTNNEHESIRTGPWSNGRRWPGLHLDGRVCLQQLPEEGKPAGAVWCFGQCSDGKLWVLPHVDATLTRTIYLSVVAGYGHTFMETVLPHGCGHYHKEWNVLDKQERFMEAPPCNLQDLMLVTSWCQIPQHTFNGPNLNCLGLVWQHKGNQHNIRRVVILSHENI